MVLYTKTEVETLLRSECKRKRDSFEGLESTDFGSAIFNMESFKGRRGEMHVEGFGMVSKWKVVAFRTDGIRSSITFVSGCCNAAPNAERLLEQGYNIPLPQGAIDVNCTTRGLFCLQEGRCDILSTTERPNICVVDPGFVKPIHVASLSSESTSVHEASHWWITEEEWMESSGRKRKQEAEMQRREGTEYGRALKDMEDVGRRKSVTSNFIAYCGCMLNSLKVRGKELLSVARRVATWMHKRKMASFVGKVCDKLFGRESLRWQKNTPPEPLSKEKRESLLLSLRKRKHEAKNPTVVFFGDAGFGATMKGHNAIPKKKILRELCHRGLTILLDEYRTSKMCPCGTSELRTTAGRLRGHQTDGSLCPFLCSTCDRDSLAAMNMLQCALCALGGQGRPKHLCRK